MNSSYVPVGDFLCWNLHKMVDQRLVNTDWVIKLKQKQYQHRITFGSFVFPGSIVIAEYCGQWYLVDGQHRSQMLKEIAHESPDVKAANINVERYLCGNNLPLLQSIYAMANDRYIFNGTLNAEGKIFATNDVAQIIVRWLQNKYPLQVGSTLAPKLDCNILMKFINESCKVNSGNANIVCNLIETANLEFSQILSTTNAVQYERCLRLSGFFLPYKQAKCRWMNEILVKL